MSHRQGAAVASWLDSVLPFGRRVGLIGSAAVRHEAVTREHAGTRFRLARGRHKIARPEMARLEGFEPLASEAILEG